MSDLSIILRKNDNRLLISAFVISRVILDDFLHCFLLGQKGFKQELIIEIDSEHLKYFFKMGKEAYEFNNRFYDGKRDDLLTEEQYKLYVSEFKDTPKNKIYIRETNESKDGSEISFKPGKTVHSVYSEIIEGNLGPESALAYIFWRRFSSYIHHTTQTFYASNNIVLRDKDVASIRLVLFYSCKTLGFCIDYFLSEFPSLKEISDKILRLLDELSRKLVKLSPGYNIKTPNSQNLF